MLEPYLKVAAANQLDDALAFGRTFCQCACGLNCIEMKESTVEQQISLLTPTWARVVRVLLRLKYG